MIGTRAIFVVGLAALAPVAVGGPGAGQEEPMRPNMVGQYGPWLADQVLGSEPGRLSFRTGRWARVDEWRAEARERVLELLAPVDLGGVPEVTVVSTGTFDGLDIQRLTWSLPAGPPTEAVLLKPTGATGPLPGILALHDHAGNKYLGWRKIVRTGDDDWEVQLRHQAEYYEGLAWANEIARRGYVVLVHDTFPFGSRRVRVEDVSPQLRRGAVDPEPDDLAGIEAYNDFASAHEHIMEKSLISAGTTWPGVYVVEDQRALDVLASRPEVDATRLGCAGLSGGGMRTVFLGGLDERIEVAVAVGFMTTWRDFVLDKCFTHTWMTYVPLLPRDLDFPEIFALRAPAATMFQHCREDPLFSLAEVERADAMLRAVFDAAGASDHFQSRYYDGGHKFDRAMQTDAFAWIDRSLKEAPGDEE
jgi:dienelactone hydrolase